MNYGIGESRKQDYYRVFCQRWLEFIALLHIFGGLALSFDWPQFLWLEYRAELLNVFNLNLENDSDTLHVIKMLSRLLGPTIASWGALMFYLVRQLPKSIGKSSSNTLIIATSIWFILDSVISYSYGMNLHLVINSMAVGAIILPLIVLRVTSMYKMN